jgi:hypothetical protein
VARLSELYSLDLAKPFETKVWKEETWAGRKKEGTTAIFKGQDIDHVTGRSFFHTLKYSQEVGGGGSCVWAPGGDG